MREDHDDDTRPSSVHVLLGLGPVGELGRSSRLGDDIEHCIT